MENNYLELISLIIEDQLNLQAFVSLFGGDQNAAEEELEHLSPMTYTNTTEQKPIYFFKGAEYPHLNQLFHCSKLYSFAKGGSPYRDHELSSYDTRDIYPYVQVGVYDISRKAFVAGLRFLPLYKDIPFDMSAMNGLFFPVNGFVDSILPQTLELGQTFILPELGRSALGAQYLFSAMASMIALNKDARFLCGKPTIEGRIPDIGKKIISSFAYEAFSPASNLEMNPSGKDLLCPVEGVVSQEILPLVEIVNSYNLEVRHLHHSELEYMQSMSAREKKKITETLLLYYGGALPPMFRMYSSLTEEGGLICLCPSVVNPLYTTKAWEFPILLDKTKISSLHKQFLDHYSNVFKNIPFSY
jgi:hypothetical protein